MKKEARTEASRAWVALGSVAGGGAVAMAAAGAHLPLDAAALHLIASGAQMEGWHAIALVLCGVLCRLGAPRANRAVHLAALAFLVGMALFCGDVYVLALAGRHLGVAPVGGTLLMAGWACLAVSAFTSARPDPEPAPGECGRASGADPAG